MFTRIAATGLVIAFASTAQATSITDVFSSYVAFGDSLSDDGKLGLPEPYFNGQFSSGPVWSEIIGGGFEDVGLAYDNYALGGATAGDVNANAYPPAAQPFATFNSQIDTFIADASGDLGENPLFQVLFGANDIFQLGGNAAVAAANAVADGIIRIAALSTQYDDFVVSNYPTVASLPNIVAYNTTLAMRLAEIESTGINIVRLDQNAFQADLFPRLADLGVTNVTEPCLTATSDCTIVGVNADGSPMRDLSIADTYYLIDDVHPAAVPQAEFARFAIGAIEDSLPAPVPLPASAPLLLLGAAALVAARRRKAA